MTDPARETMTQATAFTTPQRHDPDTWIEQEIHAGYYAHIVAVNDGETITLWQEEDMVTTQSHLGPDLCAAIDTISGGEYRARIEREMIERLIETIETRARFLYEDGNAPVGKRVEAVELWKAVKIIRAQQPSDQHATQTQGVEG